MGSYKWAISPAMWIMVYYCYCYNTLLMAPLTTTPEPPSKPYVRSRYRTLEGTLRRALKPRPSIYPLLDPKCPVFGTIYLYLRVQAGSWKGTPNWECPKIGDPNIVL